MDSKNKVILISVIAGILVIGLVVGVNVSGKAVATPEEASTDFAIDAWGYKGWGDCSSQYGTRAQLDAFCASKGYAKLADGDACKHSPASQRWRWDGRIPMVKGRSTGNGDALTAIKCTTSSRTIERRCLTYTIHDDELADITRHDLNGDGLASGDEICDTDSYVKNLRCTQAFEKDSRNTYIEPLGCSYGFGDSDTAEHVWVTCCFEGDVL